MRFTGDITFNGPCTYRRLPLRDLQWMPDRRPDCIPKPTEKGFRKGMVPPNKGMRFSAEPLTAEETQRLLDACPVGKIGDRNRGLIGLLACCGLRIHEALLLKPHHIDRVNHEVTVLRGKGGKRRVVGIDDQAIVLIDAWEVHRGRLGVPVDAPLFCSASQPNPGQPLFQAYVRALLHRLGRQAEIPKRVHPHGMRHSMAVGWLRRGAPLPLIQRQLGHTSLATTAVYLAGLGAGEHVDWCTSVGWMATDQEPTHA